MRTIPSSSRHTSVLLFYGYPDTLIAEVLGVSLKQARRYKRGQIVPPEPARRLWIAWKDGKLMPWDGWSFDKHGVLWSPEGEPIEAGQLRAYRIIYQLARERVPDVSGSGSGALGR